MLPQTDAPPDPYVLAELSRDLRPPRLRRGVRPSVRGRLALEEPITVAAVFRPPWLEAVAAEPGVAQSSIGEALARYGAAWRAYSHVVTAWLLAARRSPRWSR